VNPIVICKVERYSCANLSMSDYGKQLGSLLRCVCAQVASAYVARGAKGRLLCLQSVAAALARFVTTLGTRPFLRHFLKARCIESFVDGLLTLDERLVSESLLEPTGCCESGINGLVPRQEICRTIQ